MAVAQILASLSSAKPSRLPPSRLAACAARPPPGSPAAAAALSVATPPEDLRGMVAAFDPAIPLASAWTPPSSWYHDPAFLRLELDHVFLRGWQAVGHIGQIKNPNDFFTGRLGKVEFIICRDANGKLHAFHNVCRHHASLLACGSGQKTCFQCPYHVLPYDVRRGHGGLKDDTTELSRSLPLFLVAWGYDQMSAEIVMNYVERITKKITKKLIITWASAFLERFECFAMEGWTYGLDGMLLKATRISGIKNFHKNDFGLIPIRVTTWGPFVLARFDCDPPAQNNVDDIVGTEWLGSASALLTSNGIDTSLPHVCRREYIIECNWKVFCDNYLDGGYHVPYAHGGLASGLKLESYETLTYERVSIQRCESAPAEQDDFDRLGAKALYAFIYPNFMVNRYGPWMDTNLVVPLGATRCKVVFDYFLDESLVDDKSFIERSLQDSERVQMEDIALCEGVQRGLESPAYCSGRYAPSVEKAMHHFHCLLHAHLGGH